MALLGRSTYLIWPAEAVFSVWSDRAFFERVCISESGAIAWSDEIDLCPDALYMQLTGKSVEDLMPAVRTLSANA